MEPNFLFVYLSYLIGSLHPEMDQFSCESLVVKQLRVVSVGVFVYVAVMLPLRFLTALVTVSAICS